MCDTCIGECAAQERVQVGFHDHYRGGVRAFYGLDHGVKVSVGPVCRRYVAGIGRIERGGHQCEATCVDKDISAPEGLEYKRVVVDGILDGMEDVGSRVERYFPIYERVGLDGTVKRHRQCCR